MIIKYIVCDGSLPQITNKKKCEKFCKKLIKIMVKNDEECTELFDKAISVIDEVGRADRDTVRTSAYTQRIIDCCKNKYLMNMSSDSKKK